MAEIDTVRNAMFIEWLDNELANKRLSVEQVAALGDFSSSSITHIRKNRKNVGLTLTKKIARALGYDEDYVATQAQLFDTDAQGEIDEVEKDIQRIRQLYKRMSPEQRESYIAVGEAFIARASRSSKHKR